jgi:hypothetical protein
VFLALGTDPLQDLLLELILAFSGRLRAGPSPLRSAIARRRLHGARPAPRRSATRAPWARLRSPAPSPRPPGRWPPPRLVASLFGTRGPARLPRIPSPRPTRRSTCARAGRAAATSADARRCSPQGGTCAPSRSLPLTSGGTWFPPGGRCALLGLRVDLRARVPVGPPLRPPTLGGVHLKGGRALPPGHYLSPVGGRGSLPAGGVLSSAYASIYVRARRLGRRYARRRSAVSTSGGDARPLSVTSPLIGGDGGGRGPLLGSTVPARR